MMTLNKEWANELYQKGIHSFALRNYENAIQHFSEAIDIKPNNFRFYVYRAFSRYYLNQDDIEDALSDVDHAICLCAQQTHLFRDSQHLAEVRQSIIEGTLYDPLQEFLQ